MISTPTSGFLDALLYCQRSDVSLVSTHIYGDRNKVYTSIYIYIYVIRVHIAISISLFFFCSAQQLASVWRLSSRLRHIEDFPREFRNGTGSLIVLITTDAETRHESRRRIAPRCRCRKPKVPTVSKRTFLLLGSTRFQSHPISFSP